VKVRVLSGRRGYRSLLIRVKEEQADPRKLFFGALQRRYCG
jgi:hypothetical protein